MTIFFRHTLPFGLVAAVLMYAGDAIIPAWQMFGLIVFGIGCISGGWCFLSLFAAIFGGVMHYEHKAEKDRVRELNRHAGVFQFLWADGWRLYQRGMPQTVEEIPAHNKRYERHNKNWDAETDRFNTANAEIMPRHERSENIRSRVASAFFIIVVCGGLVFFLLGQ